MIRPHWLVLALVLALSGIAQAQPVRQVIQVNLQCTNPGGLPVGISQTANTKIISGVAGKKIYICAILLISAGLQNISIVEGTGGTCGTNQQSLMGAITTPSTQIATSSGFSAIASAAWLPEITAGDDICILQSTGQNLSGTVTYIIQ